MENTQDLLTSLVHQSRQQLVFIKILCGICAVLIICMLILTVCITNVAKEVIALTEPLEDVMALAEPLKEVAGQVKSMTQQAETVMGNLETVTRDLADSNLGAMVEQVNNLVCDGQTAIAEAMKKLDTIDIDTLNKAIEDLADVVEPLAKVSNFFS